VTNVINIPTREMTQPVLPKVELHCHLLGVIDPALLRQIRHCGGAILVEPAALDAAYPIYDIGSFRRWVEVLKPYQAAPLEATRPVLAAHIANLIAQRVVYSEIMISPTMFPRELPELLEAFHEWREWVYDLERGQVQIEFIMVVPRTLDPDVLKRDTETFVSLYREGLIVGVALVGPENGESIKRFAFSFARWREAGLGIEIHAGEHSGPESIWEALRYGRPDRLGHCLSAFHDSDLVDEIRRRKVHIEFCLTSNVRTGAVMQIKEHPVGRAKDLGMSFSLSTDNPGAFECSLTSEFRLAMEELSFKTDDFKTLFQNALASRFQPKLRYLKASPDFGNAGQ
jgi:aminodeoxyfutalosine deaminase